MLWPQIQIHARAFPPLCPALAAAWTPSSACTSTKQKQTEQQRIRARPLSLSSPHRSVDSFTGVPMTMAAQSLASPITPYASPANPSALTTYAVISPFTALCTVRRNADECAMNAHG